MVSTTFVAMRAPSTETPMVPPSERKKAMPELATPISAGVTAFCTISTRFCMTMPRPAPRMNMNRETRMKLVS